MCIRDRFTASIALTDPLNLPAPGRRQLLYIMGKAETFHGYAPDLGYEFLRNAIAENDYKARGCDIAPDERCV